MSQKQNIIFVCEHGAAKSIIAASYFNKLATEHGLNMNAIARATHPDPELSPKTVEGLLKDGLRPTELAPQELLPADLGSAEKIIAFCELPEKYQQSMEVERWDDVPPVSADYRIARDAILERLNRLMMEIR